MKNNKQLYSVILSISFIFGSINPAIAEVREIQGFDMEETIQIAENEIKEEEKINEEDINYNQNVIDEINNNPIGQDVMTDTISETTLETTSKINVMSSADTELKMSSDISLMSTSTAVPVEFKIEPVNAPFNVYNNSNESVSLATGAMNFEKTLLSFPGRNGLDLNLGIKYNSEDAVITENEFDDTADIRNSNFTSFAIGWSFNFTTILKNQNTYGYTTDTSLRFSDGSTYKIKNDRDGFSSDLTLDIQNYLLEDLTLERKADSKEYVLTYSNGIKEYFDGTYGTITKREDRFGNCILFEYEDIDYFRGSFFDYIFNPSFYSSKLHALSKITDSSGRIINISYNVNQSNFGNEVSTINILVDGTTYATINLGREKSYNGEVDIVQNIIDGEGLSTNFEYDEKIAHIYYQNPYNSAEPSYTVNGSAFVMSKITYPTGGYTEYNYSKERRSYSYYIPYSLFADWYHVYKVSSRVDSTGDKTEYMYEGDRSGYPYSHLKTDEDAYSNPNGYIADTSVKYHTIVKHNNATTIHSFDYMHNKISEQVYDESSSRNTYINSRGDASWNVMINNNIYRVDVSDKSIYVYMHSENSSETTFLKPYNFDEEIEISNVKTKGNNIYVFYRTGSGTSSEPYVYNAKVFNVSSRQWSEGGSYTTSSEYGNISDFQLWNMYYNDGVFFAYYANVDNNKLYHLFYDTSANINSRWRFVVLNTSLYDDYKLKYMCQIGDMIYYAQDRFIYEYNTTDNTVKMKEFKSLEYYTPDNGFSIYGKTYVYSYKRISEFDFATGSVKNKYTYPFEFGVYDKLQKGTDGNMYFFGAVNEGETVQKVYRFNPNNENPWELLTYRLFDNSSFNVIMGNNVAYLTVGLNSGPKTQTVDQYSDTMQKNYGGFEKIKLNATAVTEGRTRTDNQYNSYNQLISSTYTSFKNGEKKTSGKESQTYVSGKNIVASQTDILGNKTTYKYNSNYYVPTEITAYSGTDNAVVTENTLSSDYKKISSSTTTYDDRAVKTEYIYDTTYPGNVISEASYEIKDGQTALLNTSEFTYDSKGIFVTQNKVKDVATNNSDFTVETSDFTSGATYNNMGLLASETDSKGNTTSYEYNRNGWLTKTTNPDGSYVETTYSITGGTNNKVTTSYNGQYFTVDYYDNMGRIKYHKEKTESGTERNLNLYYYNKNRLTSVFDGNNSSEKYTYDSFDRVITVKNYNKDNKTLISTQSVDYNDYDLSKTVNVGGKTITSYYDVVGRLIKEEQYGDAGLSTVLYEYDYMGNVVKTTDANGGTVTNTYNDMGQLLSVADQLNQTTSYEYDSYGNVNKATYNNGSVYLYEYDNVGRLLKTTDPLGAFEYYAYDKVGNVIAYKDKKEQVTNSTYDKMNRVLSKQTGDLSVSYTYDNFGNVLTMNDTTGTTSYTYQYNNLLSGITTPDNKTISYSYDKAGNVAGVTDYAGNVYSYTYDGLNRVDTITKGETVVADYDYTDFGTIDKVTYPEGSSQYTYDNALRVISQTNTLTSGNVINQYSYGYDPAGNQIYKIDSSGGTEKVTSYDYDAANRLIFVTEPDNTITSYTYDSGNNIMTKDITHPESYEFTFKQNGSEHTISGISTHNFTYSYNALNQLMQETEHVAGSGNTYSGYLEIVSNYTYDGNGNTISAEKAGQIDESVVQYSYNEWNQLVQYTDADNNVTNYGYDGTGMRVSKTQGDTIQKYYWDRGYISNEAEGSNFYAANYIGVQGVFARENQGSTDYLFKNSHGDVTALVNSGDIVRTYDYDAYGTQKNINPSDTNPFRYCGEYFDSETQNIYLRNRYYNPEIGRFITEDPIRDGLNWYVYCENNPIMFIDSLGLFDYDTELYYSPNLYNKDVEILQNELAWNGYLNTNEIDGYFGHKTELAVMEYQRRNNLEVNGVVNQEMWKKLGLRIEPMIFFNKTFTVVDENKYTVKADLAYVTNEYGKILSVEPAPLNFEIINNAINLDYEITSISAYKNSDYSLGVNVKIKETLAFSIPGLIEISLPIEMRTIEVNNVFWKAVYFE